MSWSAWLIAFVLLQVASGIALGKFIAAGDPAGDQD